MLSHQLEELFVIYAYSLEGRNPLLHLMSWTPFHENPTVTSGFPSGLRDAKL